jgi:predicted phosphodiesterase
VKFISVVCWGWLLVGCTDVADDRAERDEFVGHYRDATTRIDVEAGLAVIRAASRGGLKLWSSAPTWTASVAVDDSAPLVIEVRNLIPGSVLVAKDARGELVQTRIVGSPLPTRRTFAIEPPRSPMQLTLVPPSVADSTVRFAVLGDIQNAIVDIQDVYQRIAAEPSIDFVLSPGDLTAHGSRAELEWFETELQQLPVPFYSTLGNHELGTSPPPYQEVFGRANLHFHYRDTAFSLVDSASATISQLSFGWLEGWLGEDRGRAHVFVTHYPPIDPIGVRNGSFASRLEAHRLIARLADGRVDLSLHGHIHSFYAFTMAGIPAYISGGGGAIPERFDGIGRHFLVVEVGKDAHGHNAVTRVRVVRVD